MRHTAVLILFIATLLSAACGGGRVAHVPAGGDTLHLRHAEHLTLVDYDSLLLATVRNPWDTTRILQRYVLVPDSLPLPAALPEGILIRTPVRRAGLYSAIHCSLLQQLGLLSHIAGVCDLDYIHLDTVHTLVRQGRVQHYGSGMNPDLERLIDSHPDALFPSPYENNGGYGRLAKLGIPLVECADYMEPSPLGRAEWMRFYGRLFGKGTEADSLFAAVESRYLSLRNTVAAHTAHRPRPTLLCDLLTGATWYVPGARSWPARYYADAGADYLFSHRDEGGSAALAFEVVLDRAAEADFWLIKYAQPQDMTYTQLASDHAGYTRFRPWRERRIWGCNTGRVPYYEEAPFAPDVLLADLVKIFHPELLPSHRMHYFCPLQ